ncbi:hypothetical protein DCAR_0415854 [Daucus carota subsp. sativus]|uniref:Uncharacterized protein n=1 Tax=Daucus carota subsp. sativus TaxID=79200 RepID=A0A165WU84_DAUCS|nr:hypothetical protein DCAR_0415854 [Daucus carota subsp. sativus]
MALTSTRNDINLCFVFLLLVITPCLSAGRLNPAAGLYDIDYHDPHTSPPGSPPSNTRLYDIDYHDPHTSPPGGPPANAKANPRVEEVRG